MTTQAGLERCPEHDKPLHDGRCDRCEFSIPRNDLERARIGIAQAKATIRTRPGPLDVSLPKPEPAKRDRSEWAEGPGIDIAECDRCGETRPTMTINRHRCCRRCYVQPGDVVDTRDPTVEDV